MATVLVVAFSFLLLRTYGKMQILAARDRASATDLPISSIKFYQHGQPKVFETEDFVVTFKDEPGEAQMVAEETGFQHVSKILKNKHIFRRRNPAYYELRGRTNESTIANLQDLQEHEMVKNIVKQEKENIKYFTNDQGWRYMFYMNGETEIDMNIPATWNRGYTGKNVTIAIVDDGIDLGNTDLANNLNLELSLNTLDMTNVPYPSDSDAHGTKCAGTAAAIKDNGVCGVGSAHEATLVGIKFFKSTEFVIDDARTALALTHRNDVIQIYSNSWGSGKFSSIGQMTTEALETGIKEGRNGLGSIYLFSAGNDGPDDTCNHDERTSNIYVITISSIQADGKPAPYAENCPAVLASSYGGALVNDIKKYLIACGRGNSCKFFDGTSSSTPLAAGMVALMLQANPNLTWRDVQHIIVTTSISNGIDANWFTNGAGYRVSPRLGFGLMDADAMVTSALSWKTVPTMESCTIVQQSPELESLSTIVQFSVIVVQYCSGKTSTVGVLEKVQVTLSFTAETFGDVLLNLTSPMGTTSPLSVGHPADESQSGSPTQYYGHTFTSVHFWGEDPVGAWKLDASIRSATASGKIRRWTLTLYGTHKFGGSTTDMVTENDTKTTKQSASILSSEKTPAHSTTGSTTSSNESPPYFTTSSLTSTLSSATFNITSNTPARTNGTPETLTPLLSTAVPTNTSEGTITLPGTATSFTTLNETSINTSTDQVTSTSPPVVTFPASETTPRESDTTKSEVTTTAGTKNTNSTTSFKTVISFSPRSTSSIQSTPSIDYTPVSQTTQPTVTTQGTQRTTQTSQTITTNETLTRNNTSTTQVATTNSAMSSRPNVETSTTTEAFDRASSPDKPTTSTTQEETETTRESSTGGSDDNRWYIPTFLAIAVVTVIGSGMALMICIVKKPLKVNPFKTSDHEDVRLNKEHRQNRHDFRNRHEHPENPQCDKPPSARSPADIFIHSTGHGHGHNHYASLDF